MLVEISGAPTTRRRPRLAPTPGPWSGPSAPSAERWWCHFTSWRTKFRRS